MAARADSTDPRAERVRSRLHDAALLLAHERPVDEVTVADLARRAEVSRQAFYQHFHDRDDAIGSAVSAAFAEATADLGADPVSHILALFDVVAERQTIYRHLVPSAVALRAAAAFRAALTPPCQQIAQHAAVDVAVNIAHLERFLVGGFMELLRSWMEDPAADDDLHGRAKGALASTTALLGTNSTLP